MTIERIAVIGAGTMGGGIAQVCARHGRRVSLVDLSPELLGSALGAVSANMERQVGKGLLPAAEKKAALARITTFTSLEEGAAGAQLVIEAVPEKASLKSDLFRRLDAFVDEDAILASNTSSISITQIGAWTGRPQRVIGMHFMNPVPVMRLVEVVRGLLTDDATADAVMRLARELGKSPVAVQDFPGFVSNRVLMPMINEAIFALMEGVAEAEAIDKVMTLGMNHPMGPLALADLVGLDICLSVMEVLHRELGEDRYRPCPLLRKYVAAGWLGRKSGRGFYTYGPS